MAALARDKLVCTRALDRAGVAVAEIVEKPDPVEWGCMRHVVKPRTGWGSEGGSADMIWLRTDERLEAIKSLHKAHQFLLEVHEDPYNWKWAIIALHNSIQAFMVLALMGTASLNVCKNRGKFLEAMNNGNDLPELSMESFLALYKDIKNADRMNKNIESKIFLASEEMDYYMKTLNDLRNNFIHYIPCNWSLGISTLPELSKSVLNVIEFLVLESGNVRFYFDDELEKTNLRELISEIRKELEKLEIEYAKV